MAKDKVLKLMTEYKLTYEFDGEADAWVFKIDKNVEGKES